jgi:hypothetical protein
MRPHLADRPAPAPNSPLGERAAVAVLGDSRADVAREALRIARAESQSRPVLLVDLLGQGSTLDQMFGDEDPHGVSDAARYGVSLSRLARPVPRADSLYLVAGGAESALVDDVLGDRIWGSWTDQCRKAGALLVVAGPADLPMVERAVDQLEGFVMVGDATVPPTHAPLLGRIVAPRRRGHALTTKPRRITDEEIAVVGPGRSRRTWWLAAGITLGAAAVSVAGWAVATGRLGPTPSETFFPPRGSVPIVMPGDPAPGDVVSPLPAAGAVEWSVELASVSSLAGALARVRQSIDELPVPTLAVSRPSTDGPTWYRLLAGAFASKQSADSLLAALRDRGVLDPGGGQVVRTPLAWLIEEGVDPATLDDDLFRWRTVGVPAYALFDAGRARIYAGAFETDSAAQLFRSVLDSLNLHATLVPRVGRIR